MRCGRLLQRRFIPPWERAGESADTFFAGLLRSRNPLERCRREGQRAAAAAAAAFDEHQPIPEEARRLQQIADEEEKKLEEKRHFLPYGATPRKYFPADNMAAWGAYASSLKTPPSLGDAFPNDQEEKDKEKTDEEGGGYSAQTRRLLAEEMDRKIPYRYTAYLPPLNGVKKWPLHGTAGLALDVDGVIHRGRWPIPGADDAVRALQTLRIPFVFLTNGSPCSEESKAKELSKILGCEIAADQVILAHSPMRLIAPRYRRETVVVVGPPRCAEIARDYGFERAISILEYQAEHPELVPFKKWHRERLPNGIAKPGSVPFPPVAAIFQFSDVDDAFNDIQTTIDLLLSPYGQVGNAVSGVQTIPYYQAADDLLWATEAALPRLGQGAYREMLSAVFESITGRGLEVTFYGKPRGIAYAYAEKRLKSVSRALGWDPAALRAIFMVGDNLETDILGANAAHGLWTSVHVLSGISKAPAAGRTLSEGDDESEWLEMCTPKVPHYVAPTVDHFVRELLAFPEDAVLLQKTPYYGKMNPIDLKESYNFDESVG